MKKCYFDHKTKPSTFVVKNNGEEIFRGNFTEGYKIFQELPRNPSPSKDVGKPEVPDQCPSNLPSS
jgi:hypothetical protein